MEQDQGEGTVQETGEGLGHPEWKMIHGEVLGRARGEGKQDQIAIEQEIGGADSRDQHRQIHWVYRRAH